MKRVSSLICLLLFVCMAVSCGGGSDSGPKQVVKEISAQNGGTITSSDNSVSIDIPGGALDSDVEITMTIVDAKGYKGTEGKHVISKIVEFEPSGTIFKKPVVITMKNQEKIANKIITAAVYNETKGAWSYSEKGVAMKRDAGGDPIMMTAGGDPIMLNDKGEMYTTPAAGGDPIMLSAGGDPIMLTDDGMQMTNAASGTEMHMTTGHFTAYTFIALEPEGKQQCSPTSGAPCTNWSDDWSTGTVWSSISGELKKWSEAEEFCANLTEKGFEEWKWRLPDINELRTLIHDCPGSMAGGECGVSAPDHLSSGDRNDSCTCGEKENDEVYYSILGDESVWLWSSSDVDGDPDFAWSVNFSEANVKMRDKSDESFVRCVKYDPGDAPETEPDTEAQPDSDDQEALPDTEPEQEPDTDSETE